MPRLTTILPIVLTLLLLMSVPAAANVVQSAASFSPNPPLVPGGSQKVTATYVVIPSGSMPEGHGLQMQTGLADAQWIIQVIVDGHNAARQTASGSVAFLNGALLSYPANRDVSFTVTITGTVPSASGPEMMVLQMAELDNAGTIVPGSVLTLTQPVGGQLPAASATTFVPTPSPVGSPPLQATPRAAFPIAWVVVAAGTGLFLVVQRRD